MDIGAQLPHAALRVYVMGQRGADREPATAEDVVEMRRLTEQAIRSGALGFTSSRTLNHRSARGEPTPTLQAEYDELVGMACALRSAGRGVMEMISDFDDLDAEFDLLKSMVSSAGRPMSISLAQGISDHGWRKVLGKIEGASDTGFAMRGQVAPRPIGILLGLTTTLSPFTTRPAFTEVAQLPLAERAAALADPARKARILAESTGRGFMRLFRLMDEGRKIWLMSDPPNYEPAPEDSLHAQAIARGQDPWSLVYDALLQDDGKALLYTPFANYAENNLDCCRDMILHKDTVMGLGDGGAHVGTICDASFITSLLTHWGRDRSRGEGIDLPTLIKCQSNDTARAVELTDRGTLQVGMRADVNIIDFDNLHVRLPEMVNDLPAGGARLQQRADGYQMTIVNGQPTYIDGEATDALPGRLVRKTTPDGH
jgi:N-acyl-D-aspartate/D-glutamate deacylase